MRHLTMNRVLVGILVLQIGGRIIVNLIAP